MICRSRSDAQDSMVRSGSAGEGSIVAFIDIGTNSVRLLVVRLSAGLAYTTITQQKEVVRLGEAEFLSRRLQPAAMDRTVLVCRKFAELARAHGSEEIVAVATSATREADNREELLDRLRRQAGLEVRVISGHEEARLIYQGISSAVRLEERQAIFIDIGGGSTEIAIGDQRQAHYLDSLNLGPIRLTSQFFAAGDEGPVSQADYAELRNYVRDAAARAVQHAREHPIAAAFASSGTAENLLDIAARRFHGRPRRPDDRLSLADLHEVARLLCSLPLAGRRQVPGLNPERADIIVAGMAILESLMEEIGLDEIRVLADRGLREGLLVDYLARSAGRGQLLAEMSVRQRSVWQLAHACRVDETHARVVAALTLQLFDSARAAGLHRRGAADRELLEYGALLHDVGSFISYANHHLHTYYLIRNAELLGFDQREIAILAAIGFFHRKGTPGKRRSELAGLDRKARRGVRVMSLLLRMAESLDRGHQGIVRSACLTPAGDRTVLLEIEASSDCELELWGVQNHAAAFDKTFHRRLVVQAPQLSGL